MNVHAVVPVLSPVTHESRSLRRHVRVKMPLEVEILGERHTVEDISLGGFAVVGVEADLNIADVVETKLIVPFAGFAFQMDLRAEVVHVAADKRQHGFSFIGLDGAQAELIRYLIHTYLSGRVATVDGLLTANVERALTPAEKSAADQVSRGARALMLAGKSMRYGVLTLIGLGLLALTVISLYGKLFVVQASYAAVTAPKIEMRAVSGGRLLAAGIGPGAEFGAGQPLYRIRNQELEAAFAEAKAALAEERQALANLREQLVERRQFFVDYAALARTELTDAEANHNAAQAQLRLAEREYRRMRGLKAAGHASNRQSDQASRELAEARAEANHAAAKLQRAETNARIAASGRYYTSERGEGGEPAEIARQVRLAEEGVALREVKVETLGRRLAAQSAVSPCDCVVHRVASADGEWVAKGQDLLVLTPIDQGAALVDARVPHEQVGKLRLYQETHIRLADRDEVIAGRIVAISRGGPKEHRVGLPERDSDPDKYATVSILPEQKIDGMPVGLPAQVRMPVSPMRLLFRWFGGSSVDDAEDAADAVNPAG